MSNCVGCNPGPSCGACDDGGNCGCGGYEPSDFCLAVGSKDACRFPEPEPMPMVERWKAWWSSSENKTVRVNEHEQGEVVYVREKDAMLCVKVPAGKFYFPMRTTEVVE